MDKNRLEKCIKVASKQEKADLVIKNCRIVNVFTDEIINGDIAICEDTIVGTGSYEGAIEVDAGGKYALPGFIDSHVHVESSFVSPEEFGRALVPHGVTTTISDPHEIVNVCGMEGLEYMIRAAKRTALDIKYMMPSCVPCTGWESSGAVIDAAKLEEGLKLDGVIGVGEFMNAYGILSGDEECLNKIIAAKNEGAVIDGHAPGISEEQLAGYLACGIRTDHECTSVNEMIEKLRNGMYVQLRLGSAATELHTLAEGINEYNSGKCLLCSDDLEPETILERGDTDAALRALVEHGIDPVTAVRMATINAAECYHLDDRGAISPGRRADIVLADDLKDFNIDKVWIGGVLAAEGGRYLLETEKEPLSGTISSMNVADFTEEKLKLKLKSDEVHVMDVNPGTLLTDDRIMKIKLDDTGEIIFDEETGVARISVIERHHGTGNVSCGFIHGYGIKTGAVAMSVGHDSHNLLVVGTGSADMYIAAEQVISQNGGIVMVDKGEILENLELPIAGLMSTLTVEEAAEVFKRLEKCAFERLGVNRSISPVMTLCFMALPVIPELKITDKGMFNVLKQEFTEVENHE